MAMGLPFAQDTHSRWEGLKLHRECPGAVPTYSDAVDKSNEYTAHLELTSDGLPLKISFSSRLGPGEATLQYRGDINQLPEKIEVRSGSPLSMEAEFVLHEIELYSPTPSDADGYVPQMFVDTKKHRSITMYTNENAYNYFQGRFIIDQQSSESKRSGSIALLLAIIAALLISALLLLRGKTQHK